MWEPIFEIAVYRKSQRELGAESDATLDKLLRSLEPEYPRIEIDSVKYQGLRFIRDDYWKQHGAPYPYNQVVGWVVLYAKRDQILAGYYKVDAKRLTRNCKRHAFRWHGKCFANYLDGNETNGEIVDGIVAELRSLTVESKSPFKGRYVDTRAFMRLAPYINWKRLIRESA